MEFQVGDTVVGNDSNYHRVGMFGTVKSVDGNGTWGTRANGDTFAASKGGIDLVSRATPQDPAKPRKMHPDDFVIAVNDFAIDNGFGLSKIEFHGCTFNDTCLPFHKYSVD